MRFDPGLDVDVREDPIGIGYGADVIGPEPELRRLDSIRPSLRDPNSLGPDPVYAIAMDVSRRDDRQQFTDRMLLFGIVTYARGKIGDEPVRSQGHVHRISSHSGWSPPELYEIWHGRAVILMQENAADDPGRVYAVEAAPGDKVLVPPGWAHATISADINEPLTFGALCDREYGFEYDAIRRRRGLAWYPLVSHSGQLTWTANAAYAYATLHTKSPRSYCEFGIDPSQSLYEQVRRSPDRFQWVSKPELLERQWINFVP